MIDKKSVGINALIALGIVLATAIGPSFFEETKYYCAAESSIKDCPGGLSGGSATRCYLNPEKSSWDYCRSGWEPVVDDRPIQEPGFSGQEGYGTARQWVCGNTCELVR